MHNWLSSIDKPGMFLRACFLDFSKAFDHIDHTILVNKLIHLGVRGFIIRWICSFLYGRRQAVKIKNVVSPWLPVHAGVPQGSKLGPILFLLMINDLATETPLLSSHWKYVDDLTISEVIPSGGTSSLQKDLDVIAQWSSRNNMNLNPKKCKELVISSLRTRPDFGPLCVNGRPPRTRLFTQSPWSHYQRHSWVERARARDRFQGFKTSLHLKSAQAVRNSTRRPY